MTRLLLSGLLAVFLLVAPAHGATAQTHSADIDGNAAFSLPELLRVIQLYNAGAFYCDVSSEDGYGLEEAARDCAEHSADYLSPTWTISPRNCCARFSSLQQAASAARTLARMALHPGRAAAAWKRRMSSSTSFSP